MTRTRTAPSLPWIPAALAFMGSPGLEAAPADDGIRVSLVGEPGVMAPAPRLTPRIMDPVREVAATIWPGVPVIPTLSTGGTDGRFLNAGGIPTYGMSGMFSDAEGSHAHGLDERMRVQSLMEGRRFLYEIVKIYVQQ